MERVLLATLRVVLLTLTHIHHSLAAGLAYRLVSRPRSRSKLRPEETHALRDAQVRNLQLGDINVVVYCWGNGDRPVLLVHGWESRGARFAKLASELRDRGFTPVTFDLPGHGDSGGRSTSILEYELIIRRLSDEYGTFEAAVAHSLGVPCLFYALKQGVRAKRIVAVSGFSDFDYFLLRLDRQFTLHPKVAALLRTRSEAFFAPLENIWELFSVPTQAPYVSQPLLVIHDRADDVVDFAQAEKIVRAFGQQATLMATDGLGHRRILADRGVQSAIVNFAERTLQGVSAPATAAFPASPH